ncbi:hypothetical protein TBK1r_69620 [Stieleria magnilauensis]|uniref:Uncharacterized protein n=1 Tax=Stieleria magnilauensis TaxID=2527963 RepID=A0ABX5Y0Y1_9BACT|nr:hypothetical protein TBK1r_69620 [Planctomycetes bacterium TBK1r]
MDEMAACRSSSRSRDHLVGGAVRAGRVYQTWRVGIIVDAPPVAKAGDSAAACPWENDSGGPAVQNAFVDGANLLRHGLVAKLLGETPLPFPAHGLPQLVVFDQTDQ